MPISVSCTNCDKKLKVADTAAGKSVRCPGCQTLLKVPGAGAGSGAAGGSSAGIRAAGSPPPPRRAAPPPPPRQPEPEPAPMPDLDEPPAFDALEGLADSAPRGRIGAAKPMARVEPPAPGGPEAKLKGDAPPAAPPALPEPGWGAFGMGLVVLLFSMIPAAAASALMLYGTVTLVSRADMTAFRTFAECAKYADYVEIARLGLTLIGAAICVAAPVANIRFVAIAAAALSGVGAAMTYMVKVSGTRPDMTLVYTMAGSEALAEAAVVVMLLMTAVAFRNTSLNRLLGYNLVVVVVLNAVGAYVLMQMVKLSGGRNSEDAMMLLYILGGASLVGLLYAVWTLFLIRRAAVMIGKPIPAEGA